MTRPVPTSPYVGLQPYTEADRAYFFGRQEEIETIGANLISAPLTLLYGTSGVGKSSVLLAGVMPYLRTLPGVIAVAFRGWQDKDFLPQLKAEIAREVGTATRGAVHLDPARPLDQLLQAATANSRAMLAILLDQFEEYFLYHPAAADNAFEQELAIAINREDLNAHFLISLREDGLSQLDRFQGRIPNLMSNYLRLEHLNREGAIAAIRKPLQVYNGEHAAEVPCQVEDALVETLLEQTRTGRVMLGNSGGAVSAEPGREEGDGRIEAPFLQMVLTRLWNEETGTGSRLLRLETLNRLGGSGRIVRTHLDGVMGALSGEQRLIAARLFDRLVTPSGTKIAQASDDLVTYAARPARQVQPVLKRLADARILRPIDPPIGRPTATRFEIFHDILAPAILNWRERYLRQVRQRRIQVLIAGLSALALVIIGGLWFNLQSSQTQLAQKAQEAQSLSQAILSAPTSEATAQPTQAAIRETAAAVGTSSAKVLCAGAPNIRFAASATTIGAGGSTTLTWDQETNVNGVAIDPDIGGAPVNGSRTVSPAATTTYTLTATGCGGSTRKQVTVTVNPVVAAAPAATDTPNPSPSPIPATATAAPTGTPTAVPASPTAVRPATPAGPPGVYVTKISVVPAQPRVSQGPPVFRATFLNTTGRETSYRWCVEVFSSDNLRRSTGITSCTSRPVIIGTSELEATGFNQTGLGACASYRARAVWVDDEQVRTAFTQPGGQEQWLDFQMCP